MTEEISFKTPSGQSLPAILNRPADADTLFVLGHGSGSNRHVPLMVALNDALASFRVATLRFEYPYSAKPDFVPFSDMPVDEDKVLIETIRAALDVGLSSSPVLKTLVGGHSISALMATRADASDALPANGVVSLGYPRKGDPAQSQHLARTSARLLFIQGTNDALGNRTEIEEMCQPLGKRATLHWIAGANHGFSVEGRDMKSVALEIAQEIRKFADQV